MPTIRPDHETRAARPGARWSRLAGARGSVLLPHGPGLATALAEPPLAAISWRPPGARDPEAPALALLDLGAGARSGRSARVAAAAAALAPCGWLLVLLAADDAAARDELRLSLHEASLLPLDELPAAGPRPGLCLARRDPFRVRALRPGEEARLASLFTRCFHATRSPEEWRWRYGSHPQGGPWSSVAVDGGGEIVAHYGAYPALLERREGERFRPLLAAQVGDLMSAAELRGAGRGPTSLFARAGDHFYAARRRDGVAFSYGVHAGTSRAFSVRFAGAAPFLPAPLRVLPAGGLDSPVDRRVRVLRLAGWRARRAERPDPRFDALHERARHGFALLARRDRRYLDWRYFDRPGQPYELHLLERGEELLGWGVFRREAGRLIWGDAICEPSAADGLALLLDSALGAGSERPERVEGWFSPEPAWWQRALEGLGFRPAPDPQDLVFTCVGGREPAPATALRGTFYLTRGDSDLF